MKKSVLVLLILAGTLSSVAAQEPRNEKIDFSHWSFGFGGGLDYTRFELGEPGIMTKDNLGYYLDLETEYTINPLFGIGAEYNFIKLHSILGNANSNDVSLYASFNLSNMLSPKRENCWAKWNVYCNVGGGMGFYDYDIDKGPSGNVKAPLMSYAVDAEYRLSDSWGLGLGVKYVDYSREDLTMKVTPYLGSDVVALGITLRYKFGATGDKKHVRNVSRSEYYGERPVLPFDPTPLIESDARLSNDIAAARKDNQALNERVSKLEGDLRDMENKIKELEQNCTANFSFDNIGFDFGTATLNDESKTVLDKVAEVLKKSPVWSTLEINGNTDNIGAASYNKKLSEKRADTVKNYLAGKGIDASKLIAKGFGEDNPIATNDTPEGRMKNRRVDFKITK